MNTDQAAQDPANPIAQAAASAPAEDDAAAPAGAHATSGSSPASSPASGCDVLIIDDLGGSRELLSAILRNFAGRLQVREARNGTDGLDLWLQLQPSITLLDIDMPDIDGLTLLQKMRATRPDCFVAMISANGRLASVQTALAHGASGFVIKPYKPQRILDLLAKYEKHSGRKLVS